ncbi:DUF4079 family protein [Desulfurivibrio alkaliphilus]|uniref:DUF4079 family protein n=1 Tax=Desulfurivibrio alkaliphilus (strain DSM 19089 / UNIQEM U267 / AHT2) TaxID=589865 RepID=D6Z4E8_DESAT|nr:DUF4079 family protein [Desulfurivibrio alkaliphilus]ADH86423.1 conserved hypothetical protein [Desulfurivibrio alkaliphilus AHT 2]
MLPIGEELPQTVRLLIPWLGLGHGIFMALLLVMFFYQARLGRRIRIRRQAGESPEGAIIRRHRRLGPWLALLCLLGFSGGLLIVFMNMGRVAVHPPHLLLGLAIILTLGGIYAASRQIRPRETLWRHRHRRLGILLLSLYPVQLLLGLVVLL